MTKPTDTNHARNPSQDSGSDLNTSLLEKTRRKDETLYEMCCLDKNGTNKFFPVIAGIISWGIIASIGVAIWQLSKLGGSPSNNNPTTCPTINLLVNTSTELNLILSTDVQFAECLNATMCEEGAMWTQGTRVTLENFTKGYFLADVDGISTESQAFEGHSTINCETSTDGSCSASGDIIDISAVADTECDYMISSKPEELVTDVSKDQNPFGHMMTFFGSQPHSNDSNTKLVESYLRGTPHSRI